MNGQTLEALLHSLVDDEVDERKRREALTKLALLPAETDKIANWRRQNQLLRAAFAGIEAEPVPLSLSLVPVPRAVSRPFTGAGERPARHERKARLVALLAGAVAVAGVFTLALWPLNMPPAVDVMPVGTTAAGARPSAAAHEAATLLNRADLAATGRDATGRGGRGIVLPDLSRAGFALLTVAVYDDAAGPIACGTYVSGVATRVALCAEHEVGHPPRGREPARGRRVWRQGETLYSVAGEGRESDLLEVSERIRGVMGAADP